MYDDEPYNDAEQDVIEHVAEDIGDIENGRAPRRRAYVSKIEGDRLDVNISTSHTNQKLGRLPLAILSKIYRNLVRIELSGNDLGTSGLPVQFEKCEGIYYLKLEYCSLTKIPDVVCRLHSLKVLDVRHNKIDHLPVGLQDLKQLRVLMLSYNQFRELPTFLTQVGSLQTVDVTGNPLETPPRTVWDDTLPQNRGLDGLEKTRRILQWLAERKPQASSSSGDIHGLEPIRPGSLVPRPLNLSKPQPSPSPSVTTSTTRSNIPNRSGSMDTTISDTPADVPDLVLNGNHAVYAARKIGKAYYQLVQLIGAELRVADVSGAAPSFSGDFFNVLRALEECAGDLMTMDIQESGIDRVKVAVHCGSQLLSDVLRFFLDEVAANADEDLIEDMPALFEMVDRNITATLQEVGVRFANGNSGEPLDSLSQSVPSGTVTFAYTGQAQAGAVSVRIPQYRAIFPPIETSVSSLSYASSAMSSTTDLRQTSGIEDEPYELLGEVLGNCNFISQQLNDLLAMGHMQSIAGHTHRLWNDTQIAVQVLHHRAKILHTQLANFAANDVGNLRGPFGTLANAVVTLKKLLSALFKTSNLVSEQMMEACKAIKHSVTTAMKLLDGARGSAITPTSGSASVATGAGLTGSYAPTTPLNAALGPAAARMVGKDTSSLFKKIDDLHRKERRF